MPSRQLLPVHVVIDLVAELRQRIQSVAAAPTAACSQSRLVATASCLQHVDEEQLLYTFCRPAGGAMECGFQEGEMLLLSVEGASGGDTTDLAPSACRQCPSLCPLAPAMAAPASL